MSLPHNEKIFVEVMGAMFIALGQAAGPKTLVNASVLLAQFAHTKSTDPQVRSTLQQILAAVDGA